MFLNGPFFVVVILDIIYYVCQIFWHGQFLSFSKKFPFCCMHTVEQARTQDFSQGGARFRAKREKKNFAPPWLFFAPPWNFFVQKVN